MAKATAAFKTTDLELPTDVVTEMSQKIQEQSVIATLSTAQPMQFTNTDYLIFTQEPHAELVTEGGEKSGSPIKFEPIRGNRYKVQVTVRVNEEVRWADEDNQLYVLGLITDSFGGAIGEAVDYIGLHEIDPLTGAKASGIAGQGLDSVAKEITIAGDTPTLAELDDFADSIIDARYIPNGIAFDPKAANALRKMRATDGTSARLFPGIRLDLQVGDYDGLRSVTSGNVSGDALATDKTGILAYIGNWDLIRWGFVRNIGLEEILYGDPDGLGDLKRYNQIAYRAEAVFSIANFDKNGFAYLKKA